MMSSIGTQETRREPNPVIPDQHSQGGGLQTAVLASIAIGAVVVVSALTVTVTFDDGTEAYHPEATEEYGHLSDDELMVEIKQLEDRMYAHARDLEFEEAARLRDQIEDIKARYLDMPQQNVN